MLHVQTIVQNTDEGDGSQGAYARSLVQEDVSPQPRLRPHHDDTIIGSPPPRKARDEASFVLSDLQGVSSSDPIPSLTHGAP